MKTLFFLLLCGCFALPVVAQPAASLPRYELEINLDPAQARLRGQGTMLIPATNTTREFLRLGLGKNMRELVVEVLEPAVSAGAMTLEPQAPAGENNIWRARPVQPFPAGQPVHLRLTWQGGEKSSFVFYLGSEGSFASGINTAWYPVLETGFGTGMLQVTVPPGLIVHANGLQRGTAAERQRGVFRYESVAPSYFAFVAGKYTVTRHEGEIPVSVYLLRPRADVEKYVAGCRQTIAVLSQEFGPYPSGEFAVVETPEAQSIAAGFTGASVSSFIMVTTTFLDQPFNLAYYGHEIAHQWWGNLIRLLGTRGRMMLSEAMAQYGSLRVVETLEGAAAAERYRRTGYPGYYENQSGLGYLKVLAEGKDFPLANIPENASRSLADGKGFQVWEMLSLTLGRENFRRILRDFTAQRAFQRVSWDSFLQTVEEGAGRKLQWFYEQWFNRTGVPEWQLNWRQEGNAVRGELTQAAPYFRATLEVVATGNAGQRQSAMIEVDGAKTEFTLPLNFTAQTVVFDPQYRVLRWTPEYRAAIAQAATPPPLTAAEAELFQQEQVLLEAVKRNDREILQRLLADDFRQTGMLDWSRPANKSQWIDNALRVFSNLQKPEYSFSQTLVRLYGQTGFVNTRFTIRETVNGQSRETIYVMANLWSKENGQWQLRARHLERLPAKSD